MKPESIQLGIMIATASGAFITAIALYKTVSNFKKQLQLNFFAEYTKRYQEIMLNFPEIINEDNFDFNNLDKEIRDRIKRYMRAYFDLCSEEYFLWKNKNIDEKTWKEWKSGIEYAFSKNSFQQGWELITLDTMYYADFANFVNEIITNNKQSTPGKGEILNTEKPAENKG